MPDNKTKPASTSTSDVSSAPQKINNSLRFFKTVPLDLTSKNIYHHMYAHQLSPYSHRFVKETCAGIAVGVAAFPVFYGLAQLEKKWYPPSTTLGVPRYLLHNKDFIFHAKFVSPITEGIFFRGALLYGSHAVLTKEFNFKDTHAAIASSIANSFLFSSLNYKGLRLPAFAAGMLYSAMTYYCNGSLVPGMFAQAAHNTVEVSSIGRRCRR
jgi:membrane protease YdiL (CAAX protease family)